MKTVHLNLPTPTRSAHSTNPEGLDHLRDRVRLYIQVLLVLELFSRLGDLVGALFGGVYPDVSLSTHVIRWSATSSLLVTWLITRFRQPGRLAVVLIEGGVTLWLNLTYILLSTAYTAENPQVAPALSLIGMIMLITMRAALVPSPTLRTVAISLACAASLLAGLWPQLNTMEDHIFEGIIFMSCAFVLITAVTSHVIYNLHRQVRDMTRLGQYTLDEKLGEGGMGAVYRANHVMLRREAAIKLVKAPQSQTNAEHYTLALQRFEREAQVTANLKSAHTIQLYDFGVSEDGSFYYVMELLDGLSLDQLITQFGPISAARVVHILQHACASLSEAHTEGLVHRDIKPANLFLCHHGLHYDFVKVLDFGLVALGQAPEKAEDARLTREGVVAGTPAYIAPEMVTGDEVDPRADLYALGGVAYWLLTGQSPFEGRSVMATMLAHVNEAPTPPSEIVDVEIPEALERIVMWCLEKRPEDRPASAAALAEALHALEIERWSKDAARRWWSLHHPSTRNGTSVDPIKATETL
ncbi:MAG: serine/threonine-protein kinase [Bradymonadia bacterium]